MPTVHEWDGYRVFFYSNEGREPPHVHVEYAECEAKVWLEPISIALNAGFARHQLTSILSEIRKEHNYLLNKWNEYFGTHIRRS